MALLEIGTGVPERAGDHVQVTVAVEIGKVSALRPELVRDLRLLERNELRWGGVAGADEQKWNEAEE